ncbi:hypothetical protein GN244_ATG12620 [Phytophthora infestans]|uniref:Uncharacterized protein n=1 Tax=Phytophthora infestans TaxID=4787 RepID=A0A833WSH4_PHYIN|nr:hypothetical protein GN244_ATG12620 [Phytophthora infestans]
MKTVDVLSPRRVLHWQNEQLQAAVATRAEPGPDLLLTDSTSSAALQRLIAFCNFRRRDKVGDARYSPKRLRDCDAHPNLHLDQVGTATSSSYSSEGGGADFGIRDLGLPHLRRKVVNMQQCQLETMQALQSLHRHCNIHVDIVGKPRVSGAATFSKQGATTHPLWTCAVRTGAESATSPEDCKKIAFSRRASVTVRQCAVLGTQNLEVGKDGAWK